MIAHDKELEPSNRIAPAAENRALVGRADASGVRIRPRAHGSMLQPFGSPASRSQPFKTTQLTDAQAKQFGANFLGFQFSPVQAGDEEVTSPYHQNWVAWACVNWLAEAASSVPMRVLASADKDAQPLPDDDELVQLLNSPNDSMASMGDVIEAHIKHRLCYGEDIWFLAGPDGQPISTEQRAKAPLAKMPTQFVQAGGPAVTDERNEFGFPKLWRYGTVGGSKQLVFPAASVVQHRVYDPADPARGTGALEIALRQISVMFQLDRYTEANARSGGLAGWVIYKSVPNVDEQQRQRNAFREAQADPTANTGLQVLFGEVDIKPCPTNPKDMMSVENLDRCIDAIAGTIGCPLPLIGIMRESKFKNMEEAVRQAWVRVAGLLIKLGSSTTTKLFKRLPSRYAKCVFVPDFSGVRELHVDDTERHKLALEISKSNSGVSLAEAWAALSLQVAAQPKLAGVAFMSSTMTTADRIVEGPDEPTTDAPPKDDEQAGTADEQSKHVRALSHAQVDGATLDTSVQRRRLSTTRNALSKPECAEYAKQFTLRIFDPYEQELAKASFGWLQRYARNTIRSLRAYANGGEERALDGLAVTKDVLDAATIEQEILLDQARWREYLKDATGSTIENIWDASFKDTAQELGTVAIPMSDPRVIEQMRAQEVQLTEGVTSRLSANVRDVIVDELRGSTTPGTLQQRIKEKLPDITDELRRFFKSNDSRALNIARTETGKAANSARYLQFIEEGVSEVQWASEDDEHVRASHEELNGQVRAIGEEFKPGLKYPCDPNGDASEVCNCRCVPLAVTLEEEPFA